MGGACASCRGLAVGLALAAGLGACGWGDDARPAAAPDDAAGVIAADARAPDGAPRVDAGPRVDAMPGVPDLVWVADEMRPTIHIDEQYFRADSCAVVEGCVGGPGTRRLLRFAAVAENQGTGDIVFGAPPPPGVSDGVFVWSDCHMHHHVVGFADYALLDGSGQVAGGHKQAFCLRDDERERLGASSRGYDCDYQGISAGWADVYGATLPCQWIDVTGVAPGIYTLRVQLDPGRILPQASHDNDTLDIQVAL